MYVYITILCLMFGFRAMDNINFPLNYEIYIIPIVEKIQLLKDRLLPFLMKIGYNILYVVSVCQIYLNKIKKLTEPYRKCLIKYLKDNNIIVEEPTKSLCVIDKNGNIMSEYLISDKMYTLDRVKNIFDDKMVSSVVLYDKDVETNCVNSIYYEKMPVTLDYKLSKICFMMVELDYMNEKYKIDLKNSQYNYYIVNNCLNRNFFKYYLNNILKISLYPTDFHYKITIIDHEVNFVDINHEHTIIIEEDGYKIYPELAQNNTSDNTTSDNTISDNTTSDNNSDRFDDFVKLESIN